MAMHQIELLYLQSAIRRVAYYKKLGDDTLAVLPASELLYTPHDSCNSIAQIVQHLCGNMLSRWTHFLTTDGEKEWRNRDAEFEVVLCTKEEIIATWEKGWACFLEALHSIAPTDLLTIIYIRNEPLTVMDAINRQLAHYPYHVGQIIHIAKTLQKEHWKSLSIPKNQSQVF
jgi:hypothetical protein